MQSHKNYSNIVNIVPYATYARDMPQALIFILLIKVDYEYFGREQQQLVMLLFIQN